MKDEFEIIEHKKLPGLKVFFVNLQYRSAHAHSDFECCILLGGGVDFSADGRTISLCPDDFVLLRPCLVHEIRASSSGALILAVQISPGLVRAWGGENSLDFAFVSGSEVIKRNELLQFERTALELARCYTERREGWEFGCMGSLGMMLRVLSSRFPHAETAPGRDSRRQARMMRILRYVEENCTRKLLLKELSDEEGVTVSYLSHFFSENFHVTFQDYLASLRCERARSLLSAGKMTLLDISVECGFSDVKYFNRAFAERFGCTPREYRLGAAGSPGDGVNIHPSQEFLSEERSLQLLDMLQDGKEAWDGQGHTAI